MTRRILLVGGGSGGHVYPLVAVAEALSALARQKGIKLQLMLLGDGPFLKDVPRMQGVKIRAIMAPKLRRYASAGNILDIFKIPVALIQSLWHLFWFMPDVMFAKGGYTSAFPGLVARLYFIPVYIHDSDSVPGLANRRLGRHAEGIFTAFSSAAQYFSGKNVLLVGNPVRSELFGADRAASRQLLGLAGSNKTILVLGGSQGAQQLNDIALAALPQLVQAGYQVVHQCGSANHEKMKKEVDAMAKNAASTYGPALSTQYKLFGFFDGKLMAAAYAACDIIVSRAGAGALTEISLAARPAVIVPLEGSASDHQLLNAGEFAKYGASVVQGKNLTPSILLHELANLLEESGYAQRCERIREFARPDAAQAIAAVLLGT